MATLYISPTGNDSTGNGSLATPWATVSKAHTSATAGDTIIALAGTYTWLAQDFTKALTIQGISPLTTIFDAGSNTANVRWRTAVTVTLNDITFQNNGANTFTQHMFGGNSATVLGVFKYNRCIFHDMYSNTYNQNWSSGIWGNDSIGGNMGGCGHEFEACVFYDLASNSSGGTIFGMGTNVAAISAASYYTFVGCSLYINASGAAALSYLFKTGAAGQTVDMKNCAFKTGTSLIFRGGTPEPTASYSAFNGFTTYVPTGTGVITGDPLFIDPTNGDLRLRPTSPCIESASLI